MLFFSLNNLIFISFFHSLIFHSTLLFPVLYSSFFTLFFSLIYHFPPPLLLSIIYLSLPSIIHPSLSHLFLYIIIITNFIFFLFSFLHPSLSHFLHILIIPNFIIFFFDPSLPHLYHIPYPYYIPFLPSYILSASLAYTFKHLHQMLNSSYLSHSSYSTRFTVPHPPIIQVIFDR